MSTDNGNLPSKLSEPYYPVEVIAGVNDSGRNDHALPGRDDGLVPVDSTKLDSMTDFVEVESGHAMMRYDKEISRRVIAFSRYGEFFRSADGHSNRAFSG